MYSLLFFKLAMAVLKTAMATKTAMQAMFAELKF
jgi:hypothetical protein